MASKKEQQKSKQDPDEFYSEALKLAKESGIDFMLGGGFAVSHYTGIHRDTKDLDIFCRPADSNNLLRFFSTKGYDTELTDVRWLAKIFRNNMYIDIIFDTPNYICTVDDNWFKYASKGTFQDKPVLYVPAEELIWCKIYVQNRERYDGADVNHIMLRYGKKLDWKRLLQHFDKHWHLLLSQLLNFQFVYPANYPDIVPQWLFEELLQRAGRQYNQPSSAINVCRGPIIDQTQYAVDIKEWDFKLYTMKTV
ncbi:nucleotidyltransferase [Fulvivirga ulvae]|uniref:nucleotidyltransferase n=1 Tax=Fulvivirga ulvae TaxID=2904245 RepID=UPI001F3F9DFD|nr:nucleotidyltransferase [Fulvivirga ulvae]UII31017.1 nucleotidyltransferase [Fulvivirga ulvae]